MTDMLSLWAVTLNAEHITSTGEQSHLLSVVSLCAVCQDALTFALIDALVHQGIPSSRKPDLVN